MMCQSCRYFEEIQQEKYGECKRNPPFVITMPSGEVMSIFAKVANKCKCGEYKDKFTQTLLQFLQSCSDGIPSVKGEIITTLLDFCDFENCEHLYNILLNCGLILETNISDHFVVNKKAVDLLSMTKQHFTVELLFGNRSNERTMPVCKLCGQTFDPLNKNKFEGFCCEDCLERASR